uniref:Uncharacterized protein n=1 Tax=Cyclophora tenuis TaxID=216820 RepID=A0A7S1D8I8_CYCTE
MKARHLTHMVTCNSTMYVAHTFCHIWVGGLRDRLTVSWDWSNHHFVEGNCHLFQLPQQASLDKNHKMYNPSRSYRTRFAIAQQTIQSNNSFFVKKAFILLLFSCVQLGRWSTG